MDSPPFLSRSIRDSYVPSRISVIPARQWVRFLDGLYEVDIVYFCGRLRRFTSESARATFCALCIRRCSNVHFGKGSRARAGRLTRRQEFEKPLSSERASIHNILAKNVNSSPNPSHKKTRSKLWIGFQGQNTTQDQTSVRSHVG